MSRPHGLGTQRHGTNVWYVDPSDGSRLCVYHDPNELALPWYRIAGRKHVREDLVGKVRS